jgi:hypothetical protein
MGEEGEEGKGGEGLSLYLICEIARLSLRLHDASIFL